MAVGRQCIAIDGANRLRHSLRAFGTFQNFAGRPTEEDSRAPRIHSLMCGIAGIASIEGLAPDDAHLVDCMLQSLAHRGPDDQYAHVEEHAALGARRLSIIDLETGRQPLANEDGSIWVTQNGEIYNYVELRDELERRGHQLNTHGDTEVIAHLYEEFGEDFVDHLRGMFAIAIWDAQRKRLVLARDRVGKKPLYWRLAGGRLSYGSELKALMQDPSLERVVDRAALEEFFAYQYVPAPRSILVGVQKLPPASVLVWEGGEPRIRRYWMPTYEPKHRLSHPEQREIALDLMRESVRLRMRSDVPIGLFLSGGMDSSTVLALLAAESTQPVRTFTIGFDDPAYNEAGYARAVAELFETDHTEEIVRLDAIELLPEIVEHYDEPFGDSSAIPTFRVSQLAARELKVVLNGDGGDETFGGYERYRFQIGMGRLDMLPGPIRGMAARAASRIVMRGRPGYRDRGRGSGWSVMAKLSPAERYARVVSIMDESLRLRLLGHPDDAGRYMLDILHNGTRDGIDRMLRADLLAYLPEDLLVKMDRASMANSLEARAPLLDHKLIEFAARLPSDRKVTLTTTKVLLREIATDLLSKELVERPKMGFGVPLATWFDGELGGLYREVVLAADSRSRDYLDVDVAASLLDEHQAGDRQHAHRLWLILMFELWARRWLRDAPTA
jgi:asparagine synthase (glutamine-hydrolysing)